MTNQKSKSAKIRARLNYPVIDSDGHTIEFEPALVDVLQEIGGAEIVERYKRERVNGMAAGVSGILRWHRMTPEERVGQRAVIPPWWAFPTKNTLDRATAMLPKLLYERLDDFGLDVSVLYPTLGLAVPHLDDEEIRRASCRAFNLYHSRIFREYADRLIPVAVIPMHTPQEAIEELDYAVKTLGMKAVMLAGHVIRPVPWVVRNAPEAARYSYWIDNLCLDSLLDYDPVWAKCVELKVTPTFHSAGMGWGSRTSGSNYMYNHTGHFGASAEALCKAMFFGGVTRRFPTLQCAFLEGGTGWAADLYAGLVGRWSKRNSTALENYDPINLDRKAMLELCQRYGHKEVIERIDRLDNAQGLTANIQEAPAERDDFRRCAIEKAEHIKDLFVPHFYFGCEADDPMNSAAFNAKANPFGARLRAFFSSDIGHWDVPDMTEVTEEAYELVEQGVITEDDFRDFVFTNPTLLWTGMNPEFFKGTLVESHVKKLTTRKAA